MRNIRSEFRHGRLASNRSGATAPGRLEPYYGGPGLQGRYDLIETTPLVGNWNSSSIPLWKDDRIWIRWPMFTLHVIQGHLSAPSNYVHILLILVPIAIVAGAVQWSDKAIFSLNLLSLMALNSFLAFVIAEFSVKLGQTLAGLVQFAVEAADDIVIVVMSLKHGELDFLQSYLIGTLLCQLLLILGCSAIIGGFRHMEQHLHTTPGSMFSSVIIGASVPFLVAKVLSMKPKGSRQGSSEILLTLSHSTAIILILLRLLMLFFELKTHASMFDEEERETEVNQEQEETDVLVLGPWMCFFAIISTTVLMAMCANYLLGSLDGVTEPNKTSKPFIGFFVLPLISALSSGITSCILAWKNKMDLTVSALTYVGVQITVYVTPLAILIAWAMNQPLTYNFNGLDTTALVVGVLLTKFLFEDGKSNYLVGALCLTVYIILVLTVYLFPTA